MTPGRAYELRRALGAGEWPEQDWRLLPRSEGDAVCEALGARLLGVAAGGSSWACVSGAAGAGKSWLVRRLSSTALARDFAVSCLDARLLAELGSGWDLYRLAGTSFGFGARRTAALEELCALWLLEAAEAAGAQGSAAAEPQLWLEPALAHLEGGSVNLVRAFSAALRAAERGEPGLLRQLLRWLAGAPAAPAALRRAGLRPSGTESDALQLFRFVLTCLRQTGHPGWVVVLDGLEALLALPAAARDEALASVAWLVESVDAGLLPGFFLLVTAEPRGLDLLGAETSLGRRWRREQAYRPDGLDAPVLTLPGWTEARLLELGAEVLRLLQALEPAASGAPDPDALSRRLLAETLGLLHGRADVAARLYLRALALGSTDRLLQLPLTPAEQRAVEGRDSAVEPAPASQKTPEAQRKAAPLSVPAAPVELSLFPDEGE